MSNGSGQTTQAQPQTHMDAEAWRCYLVERRRALITELRRVEEMLGMQQSVPLRTRPR